MKIDDREEVKKDGQPESDPIAGWERFFTGQDHYSENRDTKIELYPKRGFFSCYPVKDAEGPG